MKRRVGITLAVAILLPALVVSALAIGAMVQSSPATGEARMPDAPALQPVADDNIFVDYPPYQDPSYPSVAAAKAARADGRYDDAALLDKISAYAGAKWIGEWDSAGHTTQVVADFAQAAIDTGETGVLVVYAIPGRNCTGHSSGGYSFTEYQPWIDEVAAGIAGRRLAVILEPDALLQLGRCPDLEGDRLGHLKYAAETLSAAGATVYIDAASSNFPGSAQVMADRLRAVGVDSTRGFAVNVANHKWDEESRVYADEISRLLGGAHYVIDTSRNGAGSEGGDWCNSRDRALGAAPGAAEWQNQDASLWIKTIGASDGTCGGGPAAGLWWEEIALELARNSAIPATSTSPTAMISEWNVGANGCRTITVPVHGSIAASIDWGDGTTEQIVGEYPSHVYAAPSGHRTITIDGHFSDWGGASGWSAECITTVTRWGATETTSAAHGFAGAIRLTDIAEFAPTITDMSWLLAGNTGFTAEVSTWKLGGVTNTSHLFDGATRFNRSVAAWDVSRVTNMSGMFAGATTFNQPLGSWNTGRVTDFSAMFSGAVAFHQPLATWNTGSATTMARMFEGATRFNHPVKSWQTSAVTSMERMFAGASTFTQTLSTWNTSAVTTMASMFDGATTFNQPLATWDVSRVTDMSRMFAGAKSQNQGLSTWNVARVVSMREMFAGATAFDRNLRAWNVQSVTDSRNFGTGSAMPAANLPVFRTT